MRSVGQQIKFIRHKYRLSQTRFGKKIGVSGKAISTYETGRSYPSLKILENISNVYNVGLIELSTDSRQRLIKKLEELEKCVDEIKSTLPL